MTERVKVNNERISADEKLANDEDTTHVTTGLGKKPNYTIKVI